jgi:AcrR family transcriptional regulator
MSDFPRRPNLQPLGLTPGPDETRDAILDNAERLLRRFGPAKVGVTDIAKSCGMTHPNLYRFFPSKAAIYCGVVERWMQEMEAMLARIAASDEPAAQRLEDFVVSIYRAKAAKAQEDPEIFLTYCEHAQAAGDLLPRHTERMRELLRRILEDGVARGEFRLEDTQSAAQVVEDATWRFRDPRLVIASLQMPDATARLRRVARFLAAGFRGGEGAGTITAT